VKNKAFIIYNRRELQLTDIDNIACKLSIYQGKTTGSRLVTRKPALNNVYDFPLLPGWEKGFNTDLLNSICEKSVQVLSTEKKNFCHKNIHEQFTFFEEKSLWPHYCKNIDHWILNSGPPQKESIPCTTSMITTSYTRKRKSTEVHKDAHELSSSKKRKKR
jgi:hypothetical protein